jgi:hypothetical protein
VKMPSLVHLTSVIPSKGSRYLLPRRCVSGALLSRLRTCEKVGTRLAPRETEIVLGVNVR